MRPNVAVRVLRDIFLVLGIWNSGLGLRVPLRQLDLLNYRGSQGSIVWGVRAVWRAYFLVVHDETNDEIQRVMIDGLWMRETHMI